MAILAARVRQTKSSNCKTSDSPLSLRYAIGTALEAVRGWRTRANSRRRSACRARRATQCQLRGPACACAPGADLRGPKCSTRSKKARTRCGLRCPKSKMSTSSTNTPAGGTCRMRRQTRRRNKVWRPSREVRPIYPSKIIET
ncbi:unnamed protein product [Nesidiocoris tenuis]|uniref:Uncharacterized protein n=1 Tax=Nesidiocoris tenuis TaxID=355587 RepID=A0A6H5H147_9HEMI|nr:unnamed protein product [Nesidiocoris tenuis]